MEEKWTKRNGCRYSSRPADSVFVNSPLVIINSLLALRRKLLAMGFLTGKKATSAPWFVIQWTASLEKWIYWRALCGGMKVSPYLGDAICSTIQLLIRSFEKSEQKNIPTRLEFWWWREMKGGGIRRAEPAGGFFLSSALQFLTLAATTCCCSVREILEPKLPSNHMHSWFFTEENFTFDPDVWGRTARGWTCLVLHLAVLHLYLHVHSLQPAGCWTAFHWDITEGLFVNHLFHVVACKK